MAELADDEFASDCLSDSVLFAAVPDSQPAIEDAQQQQEGGGTEADACDEFDGYDSDSVLDAMMQDSQSVIDDAMALGGGAAEEPAAEAGASKAPAEEESVIDDAMALAGGAAEEPAAEAGASKAAAAEEEEEEEEEEEHDEFACYSMDDGGILAELSSQAAIEHLVEERRRAAHAAALPADLVRKVLGFLPRPWEGGGALRWQGHADLALPRTWLPVWCCAVAAVERHWLCADPRWPLAACEPAALGAAAAVGTRVCTQKIGPGGCWLRGTIVRMVPPAGGGGGAGGGGSSSPDVARDAKRPRKAEAAAAKTVVVRFDRAGCVPANCCQLLRWIASESEPALEFDALAAFDRGGGSQRLAQLAKELCGRFGVLGSCEAEVACLLLVCADRMQVAGVLRGMRRMGLAKLAQLLRSVVYLLGTRHWVDTCKQTQLRTALLAGMDSMLPQQVFSGESRTPSQEQQAIIDHDLAEEGQTALVTAFAGTGKTQTLVSYAEKRAWGGEFFGNNPAMFVYTCFNKAAQEDAARRFPHHNTCAMTINSLAMRLFRPEFLPGQEGVTWPWNQKRNCLLVNSNKVTADLFVSKLHVHGLVAKWAAKVFDKFLSSKEFWPEVSEWYEKQAKEEYNEALQARKKKRGDAAAPQSHLPAFPQNEREFLLGVGKAARTMWERIVRESKAGAEFPNHDVYTKIAQLCSRAHMCLEHGGVVEDDVLAFLRVRNHAGLERHQGWLALPISAYFRDRYRPPKPHMWPPPKNCPLVLLVDEFQDLSRCNFDFLVESLPSIRKMLVGDDHQRIYSFRGAFGAFAEARMAETLPDEFSLSRSFRFGAVIASVANEVLASCKEERTTMQGRDGGGEIRRWPRSFGDDAFGAMTAPQQDAAAAAQLPDLWSPRHGPPSQSCDEEHCQWFWGEGDDCVAPTADLEAGITRCCISRSNLGVFQSAFVFASKGMAIRSAAGGKIPGSQGTRLRVFLDGANALRAHGTPMVIPTWTRGGRFNPESDFGTWERLTQLCGQLSEGEQGGGGEDFEEKTEDDRNMIVAVALVQAMLDEFTRVMCALDDALKTQAGDGRAQMMLSTVHKTKGLEFDEVWIWSDFADLLVRPHGSAESGAADDSMVGHVFGDIAMDDGMRQIARGSGRAQPRVAPPRYPDDINLVYVAVTRAKSRLVMPAELTRLLQLRWGGIDWMKDPMHHVLRCTPSVDEAAPMSFPAVAMLCEVGAADLQQVEWDSDEATTVSRLWQPAQSLYELIGGFSEEELSTQIEKANATLAADLQIGQQGAGGAMLCRTEQLTMYVEGILAEQRTNSVVRSLVRATAFQHG